MIKMKKEMKQQSDNKSEIILYQPDNTLKLEVRLDDETVWLSQSQMAELFQTTRNNITIHISNIFKEGELERKVVCKESLHTTRHGAKVYLIGASLKDLGKKWFAFSKMELDANTLLQNII